MNQPLVESPYPVDALPEPLKSAAIAALLSPPRRRARGDGRHLSDSISSHRYSE